MRILKLGLTFGLFCIVLHTYTHYDIYVYTAYLYYPTCIYDNDGDSKRERERMVR